MLRLDEIANYAGSAACRHEHLAHHFGQSLAESNCGACDVCLGELDAVSDSTDIACTLLKAVLATGQRFGAAHISEVLRGANTARVNRFGHASLPCHGTLKQHTTSTMRAWLEQLTAQGFLRVESGRYPTLSLSPAGRALLQGEGTACLLQAAAATMTAIPKKARSRAATTKPAGADGDLFETLRALRRRLAAERGIAPYMIFNDRTLVALATERPRDRATLLTIPGIGEKKASDLGPTFLKAIAKA
jgi:ATP-dependent DNA helicase RecQ